ncbi:MAG TPA: glycosyltransferase family 39 protein, partial [Chloroflexota bacterium]|nr:glycosyltransferase family 39 protein [Chloroflexota bacterium]
STRRLRSAAGAFAGSDPRLISRAWSGIALGLIVVGYLALASLYAIRVPIWNAPDEPAHYNFVHSIAIDGRLPILVPGDYDQKLLEHLTTVKFPPQESIASLRYESHQPPLYYLVAAPALVVTRGASLQTQVVALRLVTVIIGALFVLTVYRIARYVFPNSTALPLGAAAFVAFIPMHLFMDAAIDNDALAELMLGNVLIIVLDDLDKRGDPSNDIRAGIGIGLAVLTKLVAALSIPLVVIGFLASAYLASDRNQAARELPKRLIRAGVVAALISGWWVVRNLFVYGITDPFGLRRHAEVVVGQPETGLLTVALARQMILTAFHSFWGQFGWMGIPYSDRTYDVLATVSTLIALGAILFLWRMIRGDQIDRDPAPLVNCQRGPRRIAVGILLAEAILVVVGIVFYNAQYLQPQGRYLFPTLPAGAVLTVGGIGELFRERYVGLIVGLGAVALFGFGLWSLFSVVGPGFAGS